MNLAQLLLCIPYRWSIVLICTEINSDNLHTVDEYKCTIICNSCFESVPSSWKERKVFRLNFAISEPDKCRHGLELIVFPTLPALYFIFFQGFSSLSSFKNYRMPAHESNKTIILEHPSGSKAQVSLFGTYKKKKKSKWKKKIKTRFIFTLNFLKGATVTSWVVDNVERIFVRYYNYANKQ